MTQHAPMPFSVGLLGDIERKIPMRRSMTARIESAVRISGLRPNRGIRTRSIIHPTKFMAGTTISRLQAVVTPIPGEEFHGASGHGGSGPDLASPDTHLDLGITLEELLASARSSSSGVLDDGDVGVNVA